MRLVARREDPWRRRAEELSAQLEILRVAHAGLARRERAQLAEAATSRAARALPRFVTRYEDGPVVYVGPSRAAAVTAARNARWARPQAPVAVFDGDAVVWRPPSRA